ncbi:DUF2079 domain-containing protein [Desulfovibrio aerotolerans]|uniref:DUF2079 domain-containing protein n=1 Tax=Solidesulfovibrio aerotolerans TaxID=295255 RepID=A0A7C9ITV7_9BACT|nr:DUF2079 domain-containing protein [Solidesulfovibrio aerotolerans]MYL85027.1 DUF2079 domain-containing protein [Solidesulfovibrio aerotolerans]
MLKDHAPALLPEPPSRGVGGAVFAGLFACLAAMSCFKYLALHSTVFDLGVFLSNLHSLHAAGQWWRAFLEHAQPLLPVYAQIYRLVPDQAAPLVLLTSQALVLALPALLAGRRHGMLAALAYALYFPVWTNGLFDFHLDHLLIPLLYGFLAAATTGRFGLAILLGLAPALVKEPYALTTIFCGLYLWCVEKQARAGLGLIVFGALYFFVVTVWLVPFCTADNGLGIQSGGYSWLGGDPGTALATLLTEPGKVLAVVFGVPGKWKYLLLLFGSLLFFPLLRPKLLLPALPALALALLSTNPSAYGWANHCTAGVAGVLFFIFCQVLGPVRILARQSGAGPNWVIMAIFGVLALAHVLLAPSPVSRLFWASDNFAFSSAAYEPTARDAAILAEILRSVPLDPTVPVVSQNTLNWGSLAERQDYNSFPLGVFAPHPVRDLSGATWADFWTFIRTRQTPNLPIRVWQPSYVLLDLTRPWFVLDRGCAFVQGACHDEDVAREFNVLVIKARQELETVYDQGGFLILRRPTPVAVQTPAPAALAPEQPGAAAPGQPGVQVTPQVPDTAPGQPAAPAAGLPQTAPAATPPPAAAPSAAPTAPNEDASDTQLEVEVLDRLPSQRAKKIKPAPGAQPAQAAPGDQPPQAAPETTPAPSPEAAPGLSPDVAPPAGTPQRHIRPRRVVKPEAVTADQPADPGQTTAPAAPEAAPGLSPDVAPPAGTPQRHIRPRRVVKPEIVTPGQPAEPVPTPQGNQP